MRLYDRLEEYENSDYYGFHMPGHKRNRGFMDTALPYGIDITEIEGFDDLHHASGILKEAEERAARFFGAEETHFLVNGSTVGILSGICGCTKRGDKILVARHCHKSIYHAMYLNGLTPVYLYPEFDGSRHLNGEIREADVRAALEREPDIRAVVIVSPTYDGVVSDTEAIAETVHRKGIPLIVDEAHGAHFGFHSYFPRRANALGADVVIQSLHKTLPSLTQTALLHLNGNLADWDRVRRYLDMLQSSSPSYVFMASLDACADMLEKRGTEVFETYVKRLESLRERLGRLKTLKLLETPHYDKSKLVISVAGTSLGSRELYFRLLEEYHLQMEMTGGTYVLGITSVADTEEGFGRLAEALERIDRELTEEAEKETGGKTGAASTVSGKLPELSQEYLPWQMEEAEKRLGTEVLPFSRCLGRVTAEYAYLYPPGSPVLVPGERINKDALELLAEYERQGFSIEGIQKEGHCRVLKHG